jgi:hypothetical protein
VVDATERHPRLRAVSGSRRFRVPVVAVSPIDSKRYIVIVFVINFGRRAWMTPHLAAENEVVETWVSEAVLASAGLNGPGVGPYATLCSSFSPSDPCTATS